MFASVARPAFPLFGQDPADPGSTVGVAVDPAGNGDAIGLVGLEAAMRYLTGEGLTENPRVAELAHEVTVEAAAHVERAGARLGLSRVTLEDVPPATPGSAWPRSTSTGSPTPASFLGEAAGWDAGVKVVGDPAALLDDLSVRLWLARKAQSALVLPARSWPCSARTTSSTRSSGAEDQPPVQAAGAVARRPEGRHSSGGCSPLSIWSKKPFSRRCQFASASRPVRIEVNPNWSRLRSASPRCSVSG